MRLYSQHIKGAGFQRQIGGVPDPTPLTPCWRFMPASSDRNEIVNFLKVIILSESRFLMKLCRAFLAIYHRHFSIATFNVVKTAVLRLLFLASILTFFFSKCVLWTVYYSSSVIALFLRFYERFWFQINAVSGHVI